jgi:hypothetical protein
LDGESVGQQATADLLRAVHHIPVTDDLCLFLALVPDRAHNKESGLAHSLENTKQGTNADQSWETEAQSVAAENSTPG